MISLIAWLERAFSNAHEVHLVLLLLTLKLLRDGVGTAERTHGREQKVKSICQCGMGLAALRSWNPRAWVPAGSEPAFHRYGLQLLWFLNRGASPQQLWKSAPMRVELIDVVFIVGI